MNVGVPDLSQKSYLKKSVLFKNSKVWGLIKNEEIRPKSKTNLVVVWKYYTQRLDESAIFYKK